MARGFSAPALAAGCGSTGKEGAKRRYISDTGKPRRRMKKEKIGNRSVSSDLSKSRQRLISYSTARIAIVRAAKSFSFHLRVRVREHADLVRATRHRKQGFHPWRARLGRFNLPAACRGASRKPRWTWQPRWLSSSIFLSFDGSSCSAIRRLFAVRPPARFFSPGVAIRARYIAIIAIGGRINIGYVSGLIEILSLCSAEYSPRIVNPFNPL